MLQEIGPPIPFGSREIVSFTGTREGMTLAQQGTFAAQLASLTDPKPKVLAHGDCVGADAQAHALARRLGLTVICWPANVSGKRAFTDATVMAKPDMPLARNKNIVAAGGLLIATPKGHVEELRSGTWATVRYARRAHKPVIIIIWPDGTVKVEANT